MEVRILSNAQEAATTCQEVFLNYKEGYVSLVFNNDSTARTSEEVIKQMNGKTVHTTNTISITNLSDFNFVFK